MTEDDPYADLKRHRWTPEMEAALGRAVVPEKIRKRREHFVKVPWTWIERLVGARYIATYRVAHHVLYRHWKGRGEPFTLANGCWRWTVLSGGHHHRKASAQVAADHSPRVNY